MLRDFSVVRRRPHVIDVLIPVRSGVDGYRLQWATNFDGSFSDIVTATRDGWVDESLRDGTHAYMAGTNVRILGFILFSLGTKSPFGCVSFP